jgi:hypothetical protein
MNWARDKRRRRGTSLLSRQMRLHKIRYRTWMQNPTPLDRRGSRRETKLPSSQCLAQDSWDLLPFGGAHVIVQSVPPGTLPLCAASTLPLYPAPRSARTRWKGQLGWLGSTIPACSRPPGRCEVGRALRLRRLGFCFMPSSLVSRGATSHPQRDTPWSHVSELPVILSVSLPNSAKAAMWSSYESTTVCICSESVAGRCL